MGNNQQDKYIIHPFFYYTYSINQNIASAFYLQYSDFLLIAHVTVKFLDNSCVWAQHAGDEQYIDFAIF